MFAIKIVFFLVTLVIATHDAHTVLPVSTSHMVIGLSTIPVLNADCERGFSVLRKIHTDQRPTLKQSTIISLMAIKFNSEECCFDSEFSSELLSKCKKATTASLNRSTDS